MKKVLWLFTLSLIIPASSGTLADQVLFTTHFTPQEFSARRSKIYDQIGVHGVSVLQGAPFPQGYERFRQTNEFFYVSGIESPHTYILLDGSNRQASLYLPHRNERRESVEGKVLSAEDAELVKEISGIENVYPAEQLAAHLARMLRQNPVRTLYTPHSPAEGMATSRSGAMTGSLEISTDPWDGRPSRESRFIQLLKERFPQFDIKDLTPTLDALRRIKSPAEIAAIREATRLSGLALIEGMRSTKPGMFEYELDAIAKLIFYRGRAQGDAYYSLIATASNAWFPHYNTGTSKMLDGDFLLMDYAPDYQYYMSDTTRMWPVNGKFNGWQTELYDFYLACYKAILDAIEPGLTAQSIKQTAAAEMVQVLEKAKFSKDYYTKAAENFVERYQQSARKANTSLGHWLGMATHDVGDYSGVLEPGMVFTIEPALRVPEEKIYIRLEDVVVITENGKEVLSDFVPFDREGIEAIMAEPGILEVYAEHAPGNPVTSEYH